MKKNIKTCNQDWEQMQEIQDSIHKNCLKCNHIIYDITNLTDSESFELRNKMDKPICVRYEATQIKRLRKIQKIENKYYQKIGLVGLIVLSNLLSQNVFSQSINNNEQLTIIEDKSNNFVVKGKITFDFKRSEVEPTSIEIYDENNALIQTILSNKKGIFKIELTKKQVGKHFSLKFSNEGFKTKELSDLESKTTKLKIEMTPVRLSPGFF